MWKDAHHGRVLLCDAQLGTLLAGILATPMGRVPKQNPDRTISEEGRFVHDERQVNDLSVRSNRCRENSAKLSANWRIHWLQRLRRIY